MKKTLSINLGGVVFNIDEDAYALLDRYLSTLRIHFGREGGTDEIMGDFETRISELFNERLRKGFQVITIEHVEEVIKRMGRPEEIFDGEENQPETETEKNSQPSSTGKTRKRLMRDMDDHILGGVASGIAAYLGCDVTAVRLLLIVLLILPAPATVILVYVILWLVVPAAKTAADKLIMRGESVNLENLGKTVTDSFDRVNDYINSGKPRTALQKIGDFIVTFVGILLKIVTFLLAIVLIPALLAIIVVYLAVVTGLIAGGYDSIFGSHCSILQQQPVYILIIGGIAGILLLGIPLVALVHAFFGNFIKLNPFSTMTKWVLVMLWIIALIVSVAAGFAIVESNIF
ncbi:MAG: PspC domain-containing protein [Tannerella sp.]|jgi:phage shock protein PspC (stress-responsive transcriptional regulator)|nr:PspC domain-containing protein [Tannerella sp.]